MRPTSSTAGAYVRYAIENSALSCDDVAEFVRAFQRAHGLDVDGKPGPKTLRTLARSVSAAALVPSSLGVDHLLAHPSWAPSLLRDRRPEGIVCHYTATGPGSEHVMHRRRQQPYRRGKDRPAIWHVTIAQDGRILQMLPLNRAGMHCRGHNDYTIGVELVGHGDEFPDAQVASARRLWRYLVRTYKIPRERAMLLHSDLDPKRRSDPGPVWTSQHADDVLDYAYAD